jgi:hypothetical protein
MRDVIMAALVVVVTCAVAIAVELRALLSHSRREH